MKSAIDNILDIVLAPERHEGEQEEEGQKD